MVICTTLGLLGRTFRYDIFDKWEIGEFLLLAGVNYFLYNGINYSLELGVPFESKMDLLIINNAVLVLSIISKWLWVLYLSVPLYLLFKLLKLVWGGLSSTAAPEAPVEEETDPKKKKEKKEKVKYIKAR